MYFSSPMRPDTPSGTPLTATPDTRSLLPAGAPCDSWMLTWQAGAGVGEMESMKMTTCGAARQQGARQVAMHVARVSMSDVQPGWEGGSCTRSWSPEESAEQAQQGWC